jgi:hypothetical protein
MNTPDHPDQKRTVVRRGAPADARPTIFVDLDGTLVWTWEPLITNAFMSQLFGYPISTPPKKKAGYRRLMKVPVGDTGKYTLTCCRPNIRRFLRTLRSMGDLCMLTHASRDYALAMNRALKLGFPEENIFTYPADRQILSDNFRARQRMTVLLDDEGPGRYRRWRGKQDWRGYDRHAEMRHQEKCHCVGIEERSRRDIPYPWFAGRKEDIFCITKLRSSIVSRVAKVLRHYQQKGLR